MPNQAGVQRLIQLIDDALDATDKERLGDAALRSAFLPDVLDSLSIIALVSLIEQEWDVTIDDDQLVPEIFESVSSLADFVDRKVGV